MLVDILIGLSSDLGPYCQTYQPNRKEFGSPVGAWAIPDFNDPQGFEVPGTLNAEYDFTNTNDLLDPVLHGLNTITRVELPLTAAISNPEQSNSTSPSSGDADSEEEVSIPIAHYIRKLADLNVSLHEHATTIPPQSATSDSQVAQLLAASSSGGATRKTFSTLPTQADIEKGKMFAIDQTFKLTQTLIEVLVHLYPRFDSSVVQHEADLLPFLSLTSANDSSAVAPQLLQNNPKSLHTFDSMGRSTNRLHKGQEPPPSHPPLDQGTVLLILSCYHRLVDIYEGIFGHMQACIKHSITPITEDGQTFRLPPLKVGDYVAPASAAIAMQMMLVIRMSSQLFDQMQEVMGAGNPASVDLGRDGEDVRIDSTSRPLSALTDMACQAMQIRACGMSERISSTRMMLLQSGVI